MYVGQYKYFLQYFFIHLDALLIMIRRKRADRPDMTEKVLLASLTFWIVSVIYLTSKAANLELSLLSWTSLSTFILGVISVILFVAVIMLARIRRLLE